MKKIFPKKYYGLLFAFFMAFFMSLFMSGFMILRNIGWSDMFFIIWIKSWPFAFMVAFPVALFLSPQIRKVVEKITY